MRLQGQGDRVSTVKGCDAKKSFELQFYQRPFASSSVGLPGLPLWYFGFKVKFHLKFIFMFLFAMALDVVTSKCGDVSVLPARAGSKMHRGDQQPPVTREGQSVAAELQCPSIVVITNRTMKRLGSQDIPGIVAVLILKSCPE